MELGKKKYFEYIVILLLTLSSMGVFLFSSIKTSPQVFAILFFIILIVYSFITRKFYSLPKEITFVIYSFCAVFVTTFPNMFFDDSFSYGLKIFNMPLAYVLGAVILALSFSLRITLRQEAIFYAVGFGCIINGAIAIIQKMVIGIDRVYGFSAIAEFGNVGAVLGLCVFACFFGEIIQKQTQDTPSSSLWGIFQNKTGRKIFFGIAVIFSFFVMVFSQTRGAMLGFGVAVAVIFLLFLLFGKEKRWALLKYSILLILISAIVLSLMPQVRNSVTKRYQAIGNDIVQYKESEYDTSLGLRFEMWKEAWAIFKLSPVIGLSPKSICDRKYEIKELSASLRNFDNLNCYGRYHNEILNTLARKGALGLLALLAVWVSLGIFAFKLLRSKGRISAIVIFGILTHYIVGGIGGEPMSAFMDGNLFIIVAIIFSLLAWQNVCDKD